jgi:hypothetical protein
MTLYMQKDFSLQSLADTVTYSATQSMEQIRKAPRYLRQMLVFPYVQGQQFCAAVYARGGFPALSTVYADPPSSTAQILHPEKYLNLPRENPIPVIFGNTAVQGEKPLADNVLGEMGCRILFAQTDAETADQIATGWRGDRYLVYNDGKDIVWKSYWSSPEAAKAAADAIEAMCSRRFNSFWVSEGLMSFANNNAAHCAFISRDGSKEVEFILASDQKTIQLLSQQFLSAHG